MSPFDIALAVSSAIVLAVIVVAIHVDNQRIERQRGGRR